MKTLLNPAARFVLFAACAAGLNFGHPAQAKTSPDEPKAVGAAPTVAVDQLSEFIYLVRVNNPGLQSSQVQLMQPKNGKVLYESSSRQPAFGRKIDVSNLPDGEYVLLVKTGKEARRFPLNLRTTLQRNSQLSGPNVAMR